MLPIISSRLVRTTVATFAACAAFASTSQAAVAPAIDRTFGAPDPQRRTRCLLHAAEPAPGGQPGRRDPRAGREGRSADGAVSSRTRGRSCTCRPTRSGSPTPSRGRSSCRSPRRIRPSSTSWSRPGYHGPGLPMHGLALHQLGAVLRAGDPERPAQGWLRRCRHRLRGLPRERQDELHRRSRDGSRPARRAARCAAPARIGPVGNREGGHAGLLAGWRRLDVGRRAAAHLRA